MKILVTGGAGYIGSFMIKAVLDRGHEAVVIDSLERGDRKNVDERALFVQADIRDKVFMGDFFKGNRFDAVFHFAGYISVAESVREPDMYFENNVEGSQNLFINALKNGTNKFIFSSTAAVYGNPKTIPIPEDHDKNPTSPYGKTKLDTEKNLENLAKENSNMSYVALRYFNACGGALDGSMGENHDPETHIIPLAIKAAMEGKAFSLYGTDYKTPDGTCLRDYIHVLDLVESHLLALEKIRDETGGFSYNVGTGNGISNREVLEMIKRVANLDLQILEKERREGDSDRLIADPSKIKAELGFVPKYSDLNVIVESAWKWHSKNT